MTKAKLSVMVAFAFIVTFIFPATAGAEIDAETIVTGKCTACHSADRIRTSAKTKTEWAFLVDKEIDRGAQLTKSEQAAVVDWLAANYSKTEAASSPEAPAEQQNTQIAQAETSQAQDGSLPFNQQAYTGVELWQFLLGGGALLSGGAFLRRRKN